MSRGVLDLIGKTPIIKLYNVVPDGAAEVWLKFEAGNPTGSYKDRMAMRYAYSRAEDLVGELG